MKKAADAQRRGQLTEGVGGDAKQQGKGAAGNVTVAL